MLAHALPEAGAGGPCGDDVEWALREARMLVLDGRATLAALVGLARRHAYGAWPTPSQEVPTRGSSRKDHSYPTRRAALR